MEQLKQNERVATRATENTATKSVQTGNELTHVKLAQTPGPKDAEFRKMVRRPRKRKVMKGLMLIDVLSAEDEQTIERIKQESQAKGKPINMEAVKEMNVEDILKEINSQYMNFDSLKAIISPCGLPNHWIHTISKQGEVHEHYKSGDDMDEDMRRAGEIVSACENWTCVEIYDGFMIHLTEAGDIIKIYE